MFVLVYSAFDSTTKQSAKSLSEFSAEAFAVPFPNPWKVDVVKPAMATLQNSNDAGSSASVRVNQLGSGLAAEVRLSRQSPDLEPGQSGLIMLRARASKERPVQLRLGSSEPNSKDASFDKELHLAKDWQYFEFPVVFANGLKQGQLTLDVGQTFGEVSVDKVMLLQGSRR